MAWNTMGSVDILQPEPENHLLGLVSPALSSITKERNRRNKRPVQQYLAKDDLDDDDLSDELSNTGEKRRRLTVDQVNFLEMSFNMDLKLEPERKAHIAKQLGIRPRQVAIWFQNRRARWKNKQLENEYEALKLKYETVLKDKETLTKETEEVAEENKKLKAEVSRLNALLCSTENQNTSVSEVALVKEEQLSVKSELTSPTKSMEDQSEVQDSGQSYPTSEDAAVTDGSPGTTDDDTNHVMACAVKLEGEDLPLLPADDIFGTLPYLFHQFAAANGICVEDAYNFYCDDQFGGLTSWYG